MLSMGSLRLFLYNSLGGTPESHIERTNQATLQMQMAARMDYGLTYIISIAHKLTFITEVKFRDTYRLPYLTTACTVCLQQ